MIGYYYYLTKIRPYFTQTEKTDYTLIIFSLLTVLVFGFFGIRPLATKTLKAYAQLREGERYENELTEKIIALNQAGNSFFSSAKSPSSEPLFRKATPNPRSSRRWTMTPFQPAFS